MMGGFFSNKNEKEGFHIYPSNTEGKIWITRFGGKHDGDGGQFSEIDFFKVVEKFFRKNL